MVLSDQKAASPRVFIDGGQLLVPRSFREGGCPMVTYTDLIQIGILLVGVCNLIVQIIRISKKK